MASRKAARPNDQLDRGPRVIEQFGDQLETTNTPEQAAQQAIEDLVSNGAKLRYHPPAGALPASFHYELVAGGDRGRCRAIIAEIRAKPIFWSALLRAIAARCGS